MTYPAIIVDENGDQTAGNTIEFTDPDNQPVGPSGPTPPFKPAAGEAVTIAEDADGNDVLDYNDDDSRFNFSKSIRVATQTLTANGLVVTGSASIGSDPVTSAIGFYGAAGVARPVVPQTTPLPQDIIDALVALGLVSQSD